MVDPAVSTLYQYIQGELPEHDRRFHSTRLPFVPVTILDRSGRPWGSILAGRDGKPGFITSPRRSTLVVDARVWNGDPLFETSETPRSEEEMLTAGIGIDFSTRQRNKFAGQITELTRADNDIHLELVVNQAIGCVSIFRLIQRLIGAPETALNTSISETSSRTPTTLLPSPTKSYSSPQRTVSRRRPFL